VKRDEKTGTLVMNPGSPTFPRGGKGPTMGRIFVKNGEVLVSEIIRL
jgi:predicted phosphodiesterase